MCGSAVRQGPQGGAHARARTCMQTRLAKLHVCMHTHTHMHTRMHVRTHRRPSSDLVSSSR